MKTVKSFEEAITLSRSEYRNMLKDRVSDSSTLWRNPGDVDPKVRLDASTNAILTLLVNGRTSREIVKELGLRQSNVDTFFRKIKAELGVYFTEDFLITAEHHGMVTFPELSESKIAQVSVWGDEQFVVLQGLAFALRPKSIASVLGADKTLVDEVINDMQQEVEAPNCFHLVGLGVQTGFVETFAQQL